MRIRASAKDTRRARESKRSTPVEYELALNANSCSMQTRAQRELMPLHRAPQKDSRLAMTNHDEAAV